MSPKAAISIVMSFRPYFCPHVPARLPLDFFFVKFGIDDFYENMLRNSVFGYNPRKISSTLHHIEHVKF